MDPLSTLGLASGLSLSAGLRAYLPLLAVGLAGRYTHLVTLRHPYDLLATTWVLVVLVLLTLLELVADKVPLLNHLNDAVHTVLRPLSGAALFAGTENTLSQQSPVAAFVVGLLLAFGVHTTKAAIRTPAGLLTMGAATPFLSVLEDGLVLGMVICAILLPVIALVIGAVVLLLVVRRLVRRRDARWLL